jgi:hypothetical protein
MSSVEQLVEQSESPSEQDPVSGLFRKWQKSRSPETAEGLSLMLRIAAQQGNEIELAVSGYRHWDLPKVVQEASTNAFRDGAGMTLVKIGANKEVKLDVFPVGIDESLRQPENAAIGIVLDGKNGIKEQVVAFRPEEVISLRCLNKGREVVTKRVPERGRREKAPSIPIPAAPFVYWPAKVGSRVNLR